MSELAAQYDRLPALLLVVFRIGGLMVWGPLFGSAMLPARVKAFTALLVGLAVFPLIERAHLPPEPLPADLWSLAPLIALELMVGMVVGFAAWLPLVGVQLGGLLMGQQMGLGLAQLFSPDANDEADVLGTLLYLTTIALFLLAGGHEQLVLAVLRSFEHLPPGAWRPDADLLMLLAGLLTAAIEMALRVAAPLLALIFMETVAMGFVAKTVPQLNILSLGFPLRILVGLGILAAGLVVVEEVIMEGVDRAVSSFEFRVPSSPNP